MRTLRKYAICCAAVALNLAFADAGAAQNAAGSTEAPVVEPEALAALNRMGAALRALNAMTLDAQTTNESVLETGQKLQFAGTVHIVAQRPDKFKIEVRSDTQQRDYYYDGKNVTVVVPATKFYAIDSAPPTIKEAIIALRDKRGIDMPLADLFLWGTDQSQQRALVSGYTIRPATIQGRQCMQYAFRQPHVDWQVWIPTADPALPCKVVITNTDDPSLPQYSAVLTWEPNASTDQGTFAFNPPTGFSRIVLADR